ncbi:hypothetical protein HK405_000882, partial [Cladochytrium tenue]
MDNSKGKANSAGSSLRRYNEQALKEWRDAITSSQLIFVHAPARARSSLFADSGVVSSSDPRMRTFPFPTRRPTLSELSRCFRELSTARIVSLPTVQQNAPEPQKPEKLSDEGVKTLQKVTDKIAEKDTSESTIPDGFKRLIDLARRGKTAMLRTALIAKFSSDPELLSAGASTRLPDSAGTSLLHIASASGQADTVAMLLAPVHLKAGDGASGGENGPGQSNPSAVSGVGADPTLREASGRQRSAYDVADDRSVRDAFRRAFAADEDGVWDWIGTGVPSALTAEVEERQREKRRRQRERAKATAASAKAKEAERAANKKEITEAEAREQAEVRAVQEKEAKEEEARRTERAKRLAVMNRLGARGLESAGMTPERRAQLDREKRLARRACNF